MMRQLKHEQKAALDAYFDFVSAHPDHFIQRERRSLILEREKLEEYVTCNDVRLGLIARTPYVAVLLDLVRKADAPRTSPFPYIRIINQKQLEGGVNVVVLAKNANPSLGEIGSFVIVRQERHATGQEHWELPRGFGEPGISGADQALEELRQETGYIGDADPTILGVTHTDTGLSSATVTFFLVDVVDYCEPTPEQQEAISESMLISEAKIREMVRSGQITDGFTVQALALASI